MSFKINVIPCETSRRTATPNYFKTLYRKTSRPTPEEEEEELEAANQKKLALEKSAEKANVECNQTNVMTSATELSQTSNATVVQNECLSHNQLSENIVLSTNFNGNVTTCISGKALINSSSDSSIETSKPSFSIVSNTTPFTLNVFPPTSSMPANMATKDYWSELREYQQEQSDPNRKHKQKYLKPPPMHPDLPYLITRKDSFMIPAPTGEWLEDETPIIAQLEHLASSDSEEEIGMDISE